MKKILFAMMACAAMCACSSDDIDLGTTSTSKVFNSDVAYMKINLSDVGTSSTRAVTNPSDQEYEDGIIDEDNSIDEKSVSNAYFYFYDENGYYITMGYIDDASGWSDENENSSIEQSNSKMVILEGMNGKEYPKYVVTVLNNPSNLKTAPISLDGWEDITESSYKNSDGSFIMTTSSYGNASSSDNWKFVTELSDNNFTETNPDADDYSGNSNVEPVAIYVERLASKVILKVNTDEGYVDEDYLKEGVALHETFGAQVNLDEASNDELASDIYVKLIDWKLNATSKNIHLMKQIDPTWNFSQFTNTIWNDNTNHRSYWAKGCSYGTKPDDVTKEVDGLSYVKYNGDGNEFHTSYDEGVYQYILENTNTTTNEDGTNGVISNAYSPAITGVVVRAQLGTHNSDGEFTAQTLLRYDDMFYTLGNFYKHLSYKNNMYRNDAGDFFTESSYTITDNGDGTVNITMNESVETYYTLDGEEKSYTEDGDRIVAENVEYYNSGRMYYYIPIEHSGTSLTLEEGKWGIVRNHQYKISIDGVSNIGIPVYNQNIDIIPNENLYNSHAYDLTSTVNILPYVAVPEQSATLK